MMENTKHHITIQLPEVPPTLPLRVHELQTELSKAGQEPLAHQQRKSDIDTNQSQNKERKRSGEAPSMQLSSRAGNEAKPNSDKVNAALALSTLWDNRQPDK